MNEREMQQWIEKEKPRWMKELLIFLRFPSISSEPQHKDALLACTEWLENYLKEMHFKVERWETEGHPTLFATHLEAGPQAPTLLIYNHYDVQPVDPLEAWHSPPFEPVIHEGELYARGAQDNKGQCFYLLQSLKMYKELKGKFPINIKLCIEGEEEIGSKGLAKVIPSKKMALKSDYLAIIDMALKEKTTPAITLGIRGIVTFDLEVQTLKGDVHSGNHGGLALNPIHLLTKLLSGLHDAEGRVTIPHFYDKVKELTSKEKEAFSFDFSPEEYEKGTGGKALGGESAYTALERAWIRPTLEINGLEGGYYGEGFKTVIPAKAKAKISCRLVPDQEPAEVGQLVIDYFEKLTAPGAIISIRKHEGMGKAVRANPNSKIVRAFSSACEKIFKKPCESILSGGSIPIAAQLAEASGAEIVLFGLGLDSDAIHAPNEHFGIDRLERGMMVMAQLLDELRGVEDNKISEKAH